jgi:mRNA deadenylase 3'-5' endonuclease subunit Ccr4
MIPLTKVEIVRKKSLWTVFVSPSHLIAILNVEKPDGCSTFWKRSQFILYDKHEVEYDDLATSTSSSSSSSSTESEDPNDLRTGAVALLVILQSIEDESLLLVANTHLFWHPSHVFSIDFAASIETDFL